MKTKLTVNILLISILLSFIRCEYHEEIPQTSKSGIIIRTLNHEQIMSNSRIVNKINKYPKIVEKEEVSNYQSRTVHSDEYGFSINTNFVKYIENSESNSQSFCFPLERDNPTDDKVENLLVTLNQNGEYDVFIVKYDFTKEEFQNIDEATLTASNTIYIPIDFDASQLSNDNPTDVYSRGYYCIEYWSCEQQSSNNGQLVGMDVDGQTEYNGGCVWVLESIECFTFGSGTSTGNYSGNNNGNYGDSNSTGSSDGSNTSAPIISTPAIPPTLDEQIADCLNVLSTTSSPSATTLSDCNYTDLSDLDKKRLIKYLQQNNNCGNQENSDFIKAVIANNCNSNLTILELINCERLNNLIDTNESNIKPSLETLKNNINQDGEYGANFKKDSNGVYSSVDLPESTNNTANTGAGGEVYAIGHNHLLTPNNDMYSWGDLYALKEVYQKARINVRNEVTSILASQDLPLSQNTEVYALKIKDFGKLRVKINRDLANIVKSPSFRLINNPTFKQKLNALNKQIWDKYDENTDNVQVFLNEFGDYVDLYRADGILSDWTKLSLTQDVFGTVFETPCN